MKATHTKPHLDYTANDEYTERLRERAIAYGQITPDPEYVNRHPYYVSLETVSRLKTKLIASGLLVPRTESSRRGKRMR